MVDFWQTLEGQTFRSQLKTLSNRIGSFLENKESKEEVLTKQIYSQLVARDFFSNENLSYEQLYLKAKEASEAYFSQQSK